MRHLRPVAALLAVTALTVACSGPPGSSPGGASSQAAGASHGAAASQPAASTGGGGGGGSGANGSVKYEITGDVTKSGELAFAYINGGVSLFTNGGWVAYFYSQDQNTVVQINSNPASNIFNFGDGEILIVGTAETGCTFNYSKNDASGLKGTVDCQNVLTMNSTSGAQLHSNIHATVDAHT